tara:strand:- start:5147 stop:5779 length:633 start_codon:yes stop_codon:yes gene_type:complete
MRSLLVAILLLFASPVVAKADLEDVSKATCKVYSDEGTGSGVVFLENEDYYYILTAAHVIVGNDGIVDNQLEVEFFVNGFQSRKMIARTDVSFYFPATTTDVAVLKMAKVELGQYPKPSVIPLANSSEKISSNDVVLTYGCPQGRWPSGQVGHVTSYRADGMTIKPYPTSGRSGSGVFDESGQKILGIVIWKNGMAVTAKKIRMLLTGEL